MSRGIMGVMTDFNAIDQVTDRISEALTPFIAEMEQLRESNADVRAMMAYEDRGWVELFGMSHDDAQGIDLENVKLIAEKARKKVALSALPKRAADLHAGYVFGNELEIPVTEHEPGMKGRPRGEVTFFDDPVNQDSLFSGAAQRELQYARFTDGNVIAFCDTSKKQVRRIPLQEIDRVMVNPDYPDEIIAWMRSWNHRRSSGESELRSVWVYSNRFKGKRKQSIKVGDKMVPVDPNMTAVDLRSNRQVGWTFGLGDALAGMHWAEAYGEVLRYGQVVNESLAKIVYKVVTKTSKTASNVSVKMGSGGAGQSAVMGEGQDIQLVNSSQRSFDFSAARPLAAMAASAWNISNIDLLLDSSAAGSSYGAAQSLTEGVRNAMNAMRNEWARFFQDIFRVMGFAKPDVNFPPMEQPDAYRMAQELTLYSVALSDEEYREEVLDRLNIVGDSSVIPPSLAARGDVSRQAASPDQGRNSPAGGSDSSFSNDMRSDGVGDG